MEPTDFYLLGLSLLSVRYDENASKGSIPFPSQACIRTVISRAYYYAYLSVSSYLKKNGYRDRLRNNSKDHQKVFDIIAEDFSDIGYIAGQLGDLRVLRNQADYYMNPDLSKDKAKNALEEARRIVFAFYNYNKS